MGRPAALPSPRCYGMTCSGYEAGVVTYLVTADHRILTLGDVAPGDEERLDRALGQLALGGRHSLPHGNVRRRDRDAAHLARAGLPSASALLESLSRHALHVERAFDGVRFPADPAPLASGWLVATCYAQGTRAAFQRRVWLEILPS